MSIILKNVQKKFGQHVAVADVSLRINPGEIVGLLGPNGAGKTTTIRMMAGTLPQSKGRIQIGNTSFDENPNSLKKKIGYLPENNPLYEEMTVEEYLQFWSRMKEIPKSNIKTEVSKAVKGTGVGEVYYRLIKELSKGFKQRVGLAQAILGGPEILLLDEPTEGLDPNQRKEIQQLLMQLKKDRTVIISSHVLGEIQKLATRLVIIHKGKIVADEAADKLVTHNKQGQHIWVEIKGKKIMTELKKLSSSLKISKETNTEYIIENIENEDIRPKIFDLAVKNEWIILTMKLVEKQIEDVFAELTAD